MSEVEEDLAHEVFSNDGNPTPAPRERRVRGPHVEVGPRHLLTRTVVDRLEEAMSAAGLTLVQMLIITRGVLPEVYGSRQIPTPTDVPPGPGKLGVLQQRIARGESLFSAHDIRHDDPRHD